MCKTDGAAFGLPEEALGLRLRGIDVAEGAGGRSGRAGSPRTAGGFDHRKLCGTNDLGSPTGKNR